MLLAHLVTARWLFASETPPQKQRARAAPPSNRNTPAATAARKRTAAAAKEEGRKVVLLEAAAKVEAVGATGSRGAATRAPEDARRDHSATLLRTAPRRRLLLGHPLLQRPRCRGTPSAQPDRLLPREQQGAAEDWLWQGFTVIGANIGNG